MPDSAGFRVEGLSSVVRGLQDLGVEVEDLKDAFAAIAAQAAQVAASAAPSESGALRGSLRGNRAKGKAVVTAGRSAVPYAGPINYGWPTRNIEGAGFMQTADEAMGPRALALLEAEINQQIRAKGLDR